MSQKPTDLSPETASALARDVAEELKPLLAELVLINSGSENTEGSARVLKALAPTFRSLGFECEEFSVLHPELQKGFLHHLWTRRGAKAEVSVLHIGHVDTVFPHDHSFQSLTQSKDKWQGPGVADMKGGLMVIAGAHEVLRRAGVLDKLDSAVFINSDEEIQSRTSRHLVEDAAQDRDAVLVYEPGRAGNGIVSGRKGIARFTITVHGRSAHAGNHHESGRSAIKSAASIVLALEEVTDYERGITLNVGVIQGGSTRNTVPDRCLLEIDARFVNAEDGPWLEAEVMAKTKTAVLTGTRVNVTGGVGRPAWKESKEASKALEALCEAAEELEQTIPRLTVGGGSDGNFTAAMGIPTIDGLGTVGGGYHTPEEWMNPESLSERIALVALTLTKLSQKRS